MSTRTVLSHGAPAGALSLAERQRAPVPFAFAAPKSDRRVKIWDLAPVFHCSIVGTCLTAAELRQMLVKLREPDARTASDHALHGRGVRAAGQHDLAGKLLHKALDTRHEMVIKRFAKAASAAEVKALWARALDEGAISGAYWAVLTHPATDRALREAVFGEVHMLSHLVGSANRIDIARLRQLEQDRDAQADKIARQEARLQAAAQDRSALLRTIEALEADRLAREAGDRAKATAAAALSDASGLQQKYEAKKARAGELAARLEQTRDALRAAEQRATALAEETTHLQAEIEALETALQSPSPDTHKAEARRDLQGATLLYVGGRPKVIDQLKAITAQRGGALLTHDGGIEDNMALLAGLISQADRAFFPVDCISHLAAGKLKKGCREASKPFIPLRSASLASFLAAAIGPSAPPASTAE